MANQDPLSITVRSCVWVDEHTSVSQEAQTSIRSKMGADGGAIVQLALWVADGGKQALEQAGVVAKRGPRGE